MYSRFILIVHCIMCCSLFNAPVISEQDVRGQSSSKTVPAVSLSKTVIWGPGLKVDVVLPARYFFIQAVDSFGNKYVE
jgi:hypothetical protein